MTKAWESDDIAFGVFLDLQKVFDTVPHDILINKLHAYGIRGNALKLLNSYLTNQTQYVIYDGLRSSTKTVQCGVPQGSILGSLLFIITMNDIGNVLDLLHSLLYTMIPVYC